MTNNTISRTTVFINQYSNDPEYTETSLPYREAMDKYRDELELEDYIKEFILKYKTASLASDLINRLYLFTYGNTVPWFETSLCISAAQTHVEPFIREMLKLYPDSEAGEFLPTETEIANQIRKYYATVGFGWESASDYIEVLNYFGTLYIARIYNSKSFLLSFNKVFFHMYVHFDELKC